MIEEKNESQKAIKVGGGTIMVDKKNDELQDILEENLKLTKEIYKISKKMNSYIIWGRVFGILKILIFVVPFILAIIYLPPLLEGLFGQYQGLFKDVGIDFNGIDINSISPEMIDQLKK
ncbi:MAG: hypothetical protein ABH881_03640 [bacterium]